MDEVNGETMNLNDLPEQYRKQAREKYEKAYNRNSGVPSNRKSKSMLTDEDIKKVEGL